MIPDLSPVFAKYEALRDGVDGLFEQFCREFAPEVRCVPSCSDCCHAIFDLSLVEAMYLNRKFIEKFPAGRVRSDILELADQADRQAYKFKRRVFKESKAGRDSNELVAEAARQRIRCPLLDEAGLCRMYEARPLTCRVYGVPAGIGGAAHTCGKSAFTPGQEYPTISMDAVNRRLRELSRELTGMIPGAYSDLHDIYVPLSMALMTAYDEDYLTAEPAGAFSGQPEFTSGAARPARASVAQDAGDLAAKDGGCGAGAFSGKPEFTSGAARPARASARQEVGPSVIKDGGK